MDGVEIIQWRSCEEKAAKCGLTLHVSPEGITVLRKRQGLAKLSTAAETLAFLVGYDCGRSPAPSKERIYAQVPKGYYAVKSSGVTGRSTADLCSAEDGTPCAFRDEQKFGLACTYAGVPPCVPAAREDGLDVVFKRCRGKQRLA